MADEDSLSHDNSSASSPSPSPSDAATGSNHHFAPNAATTTTTVSKDRDCPFCHQSFTSSSLGRHLDTFIRPRNPKAPDGIHDIAEIRKIRSAITRRHARLSSGVPNKKASHPPSTNLSSSAASAPPRQVPLPRIDGPRLSPVASIQPAPPQPPPASNPSSTNGPSPHPPQPVQPRFPPPADLLPRGQSFQPDRALHAQGITHNLTPQFSLTKAHWTATGVINDLPTRASATPGPRDLPLPRRETNFKPPPAHLEADDHRNAHATELALREVLRTVRTAVDRAQQRPLFDFDFFSFNFPALCLRIQSAPQTIFSSTPQSSPQSWPVGGLPSQADFETVKQMILQQFRQREQLLQNTQGALDNTAEMQRAEYQTHLEHITRVFSQWAQLDEHRKLDIWQLELMRALSDESSRRKRAEQSLDQTREELDQMKVQYRSPHSALYSAPGLPNLPQRNLQELALGDANLAEWDFDRLINKWKSVLPNPSSAWVTSGTRPSPREYDDNANMPSSVGMRYSYSKGYGYTPTSALSSGSSPAAMPNGGSNSGQSQTHGGNDTDVQMHDGVSAN